MLRGSDSLSSSTMLSLALSVVLFPTRPTPVTHLGAVRRPHGKRQRRDRANHSTAYGVHWTSFWETGRRPAPVSCNIATDTAYWAGLGCICECDCHVIGTAAAALLLLHRVCRYV
ncbi:hypothetical protein CTAM01_01454 [Colletotrichum tamarilloi]|uniref:Secreted protein n=1 Tax=Colletotrichum tamarilloi TaxID=1209934 RepID=A0ABQ9RR70_9PEZI|nr:uncharacterized protein CTAM01_01454 [Colletotrichum tamarilloi]KAK1510881.1 hypothetical protein CTAM01_01454 [Colletotrichum tamarilloi]